MLVKQIYLGFFLTFLVASCIYVFDSGLPQPPDLLMAFLIVVLGTGFIVRPAIDKDLVFFGALFLGHVALISLFWYAQHQTKSFWLSPLYYAYDFGALMVVVSLAKAFRERFVTACQIALIAAIVIELAALFLMPHTSFRSIGTFNNPNQLGYWSLLVGCCWLVLKQDQKLTATDFLVLCGAAYLAAASLSKAAMFSFVLLLAIGMFAQRLTRAAKLLFLGLIFAGTATVLLDASAVDRFSSIGIVERVGERLDSLGKHGDDSIAGRGYDRIWQNPQYLLFGAGEGAAWRFTPFGARAMEMHSTLGTVLFSYGIIGFSLFLALLVVVFRRAPIACMLYSLPIWAYGMTHQGLRDTMLWVFLGLVFGLANYVRSPSAQQTAETAPERRGLAPAPVTDYGLRTSGARSAGR